MTKGGTDAGALVLWFDMAGAIYGLMIIGWSLGGVIGPVIASALIGDDKQYDLAYTTPRDGEATIHTRVEALGVIALVSVALTFITKIPRTRQSPDEGYLGESTAAHGNAR